MSLPATSSSAWRSLHGQAIGWEPDINDGVRLNIRPFMRAELRKGGRKGAGILRWKPTISWKKDRGKEPEEPRPCDDFPWFWGCPGGGSEAQRTDFTAPLDAIFDGNRWNDLHYTRVAKEAAREARGGQSAQRQKRNGDPEMYVTPISCSPFDDKCNWKCANRFSDRIYGEEWWLAVTIGTRPALRGGTCRLEAA